MVFPVLEIESTRAQEVFYWGSYATMLQSFKVIRRIVFLLSRRKRIKIIKIKLNRSKNDCEISLDLWFQKYMVAKE